MINFLYIFTEKSNSVAHLVENEIPLSITSTTLQSLTVAGMGLSSGVNETTQVTSILDDIDNNNIDNNNINNSYNNLFRDSSNLKHLQNDDIEMDDDIMIINNNVNTTDSCKIENVYSNIPSSISAVSGFGLNEIVDHSNQQQPHLQPQTQLSPQQTITPKILSNDPNAHVYSNIKTTATVTTPPLVTTNPIIAAVIASVPETAKANLSTLTTKSNNSIISDTTSSIFLTNDLDLDDPVLSSSFNQPKPSISVNNNNTKPKTNSKVKKSLTTNNPMNNLLDNNISTSRIASNNNDDNNKILLLNAKNDFNEISSSSSTTGTTQISTIDIGSVVVVQPQQHHNSNKLNKVHSTHSQQQQQVDDNLKSNNSNSFINSNRMRLLQDTTMIDTALDLDSLDGSSLGNSNNNSQSCLVKTAIV